MGDFGVMLVSPLQYYEGISFVIMVFQRLGESMPRSIEHFKSTYEQNSCWVGFLKKQSFCTPVSTGG